MTVSQAVRGQSRTMWDVATIGALVLSVGLNVALSAKANRLTAAVANAKAERNLKIGQSAPNVMGKKLDGSHVDIDFSADSPPTILYIFSPSCGWCYRNTDNINAVSAATRGKYRLLALSLSSDGLAEYQKTAAVPGELITEVSPETRQGLRLGATPQTILIENGKITHVWSGAYQHANATGVSSALGVSLPGLRAAKSTAHLPR